MSTLCEHKTLTRNNQPPNTGKIYHCSDCQSLFHVTPYGVIAVESKEPRLLVTTSNGDTYMDVKFEHIIHVAAFLNPAGHIIFKPGYPLRVSVYLPSGHRENWEIQDGLLPDGEVL